MKDIVYEKVGHRLKSAREMNNITLEEAGKKVDVHKSTILRWENGETGKIKLPILQALADYYNVNTMWLMGYDVSMQRVVEPSKLDTLGNPIETIPLLGNVKAGYNYLAQENWIGTIDVDKRLANGSELFALKIKGDSMYPVFIEDDIVIVKKQNDFENGDIIVVIIDGEEATIKKGKKSDTGILLQPYNTKYEPLFFTYEEVKQIPVIVIGIVKQLKRDF